MFSTSDSVEFDMPARRGKHAAQTLKAVVIQVGGTRMKPRYKIQTEDGQTWNVSEGPHIRAAKLDPEAAQELLHQGEAHVERNRETRDAVTERRANQWADHVNSFRVGETVNALQGSIGWVQCQVVRLDPEKGKITVSSRMAEIAAMAEMSGLGALRRTPKNSIALLANRVRKIS